MAEITVEPGIALHCEVDDYQWPWAKEIPVLMMHGYARNMTFWNKWIPPVAETYRVYRPELRGCGQSYIPPVGYAYDANVIISDFVKVLDTLGLERVHWVGESSGGILGLVMAATHPDRIASLVLCNTPYRHAQTTKDAYSLGSTSAPNAIRRDGIEAWTRATFPFRLDVDRAPAELCEWYIKEMAKTRTDLAAAIMECFDEVNTGPMLPEIKQPVLLLSGDKSKIASEHQALLQKDLPNAELKLFEGYGHGINLLAPELCAEASLAFWKRVESAEAKA